MSWTSFSFVNVLLEIMRSPRRLFRGLFNHFRYLNERARTLYVLVNDRSYEFNQIDWHLHLQRNRLITWSQPLAEKYRAYAQSWFRGLGPIYRFNVENEICNENKDGDSHTSGKQSASRDKKIRNLVVNLNKCAVETFHKKCKLAQVG